MERIAMSQEERDWLDWLKRARDGQVTERLAAEKMGISDRWVRRLLAGMKVKGDAVVVHGLRGRPSNRRIDEEIRARAMEIVKSPDWHDFKPTFASEQLAKRHQIQISKETVRQWMIAEGLWESKGLLPSISDGVESAHYATCRGDTRGALRDPRADWRGRDGRGVSGARPAGGTRRGDQDFAGEVHGAV
jgi:hypothetical protein